ncbi:MAG: ECF-type sigma factor [Gemmatimonadota bacterium]
MTGTSAEGITALLLDIDTRPDATADVSLLLPLVYDQLREMARRRLRHEVGALTLTPTELVHEAWLRLAGSTSITDRGRAYFFAAAAQAMRRIVVDHARRRGRDKRGGGLVAVTLDDALVLSDGGEDALLELDEALVQLASVAERPARVVECRFYGGLDIEETALALGITTRTVNRDWSYARAWLYDRLRADRTAGGDTA